MRGQSRVAGFFLIAWLFAACVDLSPALTPGALAAEPANPDWTAVLEQLRVARAPLGGRTTIHLRNRKTVRGTFRGLETASASEYAAEWKAWSVGAGASHRLPAPGEVVNLRRGNVAVSGPFQGFEPLAVRLAAVDASPSRVIPLSEIDSLVAGSVSVSAESLKVMFRSSIVPQVSRLVIETPPGSNQRIPVESIATIDTIHNHGGLILGLLVLGGVSAVVIAFLATYHGAFQ